jgi:hypothetical protein
MASGSSCIVKCSQKAASSSKLTSPPFSKADMNLPLHHTHVVPHMHRTQRRNPPHIPKAQDDKRRTQSTDTVPVRASALTKRQLARGIEQESTARAKVGLRNSGLPWPALKPLSKGASMCRPLRYVSIIRKGRGERRGEPTEGESACAALLVSWRLLQNPHSILRRHMVLHLYHLDARCGAWHRDDVSSGCAASVNFAARDLQHAVQRERHGTETRLLHQRPAIIIFTGSVGADAPVPDWA